MQMQSVCCSHRVSSPTVSGGNRRKSSIVRFGNASKGSSVLVSTFKCIPRRASVKCIPRRASVVSYLPNSVDSCDKNEGVSSSPSNSENLASKSRSSDRISLDPFRGKPGSVSFCGLSHQIVEGRKLVSSPFKDDKGSLLWLVAPLTLLSSLLVPQFFLGNALEVILKDEVITEVVVSFFSEMIFYAGLAAFLLITNHVQRPYLDFSSKQWSLITGLRGYMSSAFFTMGLKVFAPLFAVYAVWPIIGLPAAVSVAPFLLGCAAQFFFELYLDKNNISCWPLLPIIFEVYRLYQLNKGAHFLEKLMFSMRGPSMTPELLERSGALFAMLTVLQILGLVCLWSLTTFLLRLFPSRPVAENY